MLRVVTGIDVSGSKRTPKTPTDTAAPKASVAGALGFNVQGAVTAAQNETLNNFCEHNSCGKFITALINNTSNALNAGAEVPAMESAAGQDVLAGMGNTALNLATFSLPGMADFTQYFQYNNATLGALGEMYATMGLNAAVASAFETALSGTLDGAGGVIGAPKTIPYQPSGAVVLQGGAPVCGPACAAMVITDGTGDSVSLADVIGSFTNGIRPTGVSTTELSSVISNAGVKNTVDTVMLPGQLSQALSNGQSVIVNVNGHFIIVDSETTVNGVAYYMTRDPYTGPRGVLASALNSVMSQGVNAIVMGK
ncbi:hypothetical protein ABLT15_34760 [Paraburkholderia tropica]|uniref:hypothetical protein n=1 Tax=Paraburkholderia tropica TaxID=92647 RepID=UPI0032B35835